MPIYNTEFQVSRTLQKLGALPKTACASCPNGVWYLTQDEPRSPAVFCRLFHSVIETMLLECDGNPNLELVPMPSVPDSSLEEDQSSLTEADAILNDSIAEAMQQPAAHLAPTTAHSSSSKANRPPPDESDVMDA